MDREALGERTITVDCDVLQGDGGTRTASVTGGFVALALACRKLLAEGKVMRDPIIHQVAAVSAGIIDEVPVLDLPYSEDSRAQVDLNCVMNEKENSLSSRAPARAGALPSRSSRSWCACARRASGS